MRQVRSVILTVLILTTAWAGAQDLPQANEVVSVTPVAEQNTAIVNQPIRIALELSVQQGWHIYAPAGEESFTIPTTVDIDSISGAQLGNWIFPEAEQLSVAGIDEPAAVYSHQITLYNTITITDPIPTQGIGRLSGLQRPNLFDSNRCSFCI